MLKKQLNFLLLCLCVIFWAHKGYADFDTTDLSIDLGTLDALLENELSASSEESQATGSFSGECGKTTCIPTLSVQTIVALLTTNQPIFGFGTIELQNILQFDLYRKTYAPVIRQLHDLPTFAPPIDCHRAWGFAAEGFFNQTSRMSFTPCSDKLSSYLTLLAQDDFLELLDQKDFSSLNIPNVLSLFGDISLEERRLGAMLFLWKKHKRYTFSAALPIYFLEHNFFLSEKKREQLETEPLFAGSGTQLPGLNLDTFVNQHLVNDRAGFGDVRFECLYDLSCGDYHVIQLGGLCTLPTACTIRSGIIGGNFKKIHKCHPHIDFFTMFNLFQCAAAGNKESQLDVSELIINYGIHALDRLTANVARTDLGQGHVILGPLVRIEKQLHRCAIIKFNGDIQYSIPASQLRFFKKIKNSQDFQRDYTSADQAANNLLFLEQQAAATLYPTALPVTVQPGLIFHVNSALHGHWNDFNGTIGYDIWVHGKEHLLRTKKSCKKYKYLDYAAGTQYGAYEGKLFAELAVSLPVESYVIRFALNGDTTIHKRGIGKSFTLGLNFKIDFLKVKQ